MNVDARHIRKILVVKNDKIGDMALSTNVFRELKRALPTTRLSVIASEANKALIEKNKYIDSIMIADYPPLSWKVLTQWLKVSRKLRQEKYDIGIDLRGSIFNIFFFFILGNVTYKIGFYNRYFSRYFLDYAYKKDRKGSHCTFQRIDMINKALNLHAKNYWPEIAISTEDEQIALAFIRKHKLKRFIVLVPDASLEPKQWPLEQWSNLISYIQEHYPRYQIIIFGTDRTKINFLHEHHQSLIIPNEPLALRVLFELFRRSTLVIAHDGGPMHLAWVARAPLIALISGYKTRSSDLNKLQYMGPLGKNVSVIYKDMDQITLQEVEKKVDRILAKRKVQVHAR